MPFTEEELRVLMGDGRVYGANDWAEQHHIKAPRNSPEFSWGKDILMSRCQLRKGYCIAQTHFAFLGLKSIKKKPLTILHLYKLFPSSGQPRFHFDPPIPYMREERFSTVETCEFRWYLMPLDPVKDSFGKNYREQRGCRPLGYEVPLAVEEVMKRFLYYEKTGKYLGSDTDRVRCRDLHSGGDRTVVGPHTKDGLAIFGMWEHEEYPFLGMSASRIPGQ